MTRFARAKGSKASNERVPNEATPWHVMKEQLLQNSEQPKEHQGKAKSAKQLLEEKEDLFYYDKIGNVNTDWAEFEDTPGKKRVSKNNVDLNTSENQKKKRKSQQTADGKEELKEDANQHDTPSIKKKKVSLSTNSEKTHCSVSPTKKNKGVINTEHNVTEETQSPKKLHKKQKIIESSLNESLKGEEGIDIKNKDKVSKSENNVSQCETTKDNNNPKRTPKKKKINEIASNENLNDSKSKDIKNKDNVPESENSVTQHKSIENESVNLKSTSKKKKRKKNVNASKTDTDSKKADVASAPKPTKDVDNSVASNSNVSESTVKEDKTSHVKLSKRQKRNLKHRKNNSNENHSSNTTNFNVEGNDWNNSVQFGGHKTSGVNQAEDIKGEMNNVTNEKSNDPQEASIKSNERTGNFKQRNFNERPPIKRKAPKIRDDKEHKRRKPVPESRKIIINGVEIEIVMFDGFPVKKEDAERLKDLKAKMIMKGIPKSEIAAAMKLERRKAEKALSRVKKFVCYHCRKSGHNLSDCPELGAEQAGTGICFKCGSTEHTHFECKVTKGAEYRHATCFICREQGHIAKQCPDNPKGVYPQGGACKICGDVTHLKKDCPDLAQQKEDATITVDTIANSNLESLEEESTKVDRTTDKKNQSTKVVKF